MRGTPARFGFALRSWLRSAEVYQKTPPQGSTWTEGGCWLLAEALLRWAGTGELWALWGKPRGARLSRLQHVVWRHGDLYFDGDGASRGKTLLLRAAVDWYIDDADLAPWGPSSAAWARRDIVCAPDEVKRLALAIQRRFGKPSGWGLGAARRGRAAHADDLADACDEVADDYFDGDREHCLKFLSGVARSLQALKFPLTVYRGLELPKGKRPRLEQAGQHGEFTERIRGYWTWRRETAVAFAEGGEAGWQPSADLWRRRAYVPWLLIGAVTTPAAVLWRETLVQTAKYASEDEVVLSPYAGVTHIRAERL